MATGKIYLDAEEVNALKLGCKVCISLRLDELKFTDVCDDFEQPAIVEAATVDNARPRTVQMILEGPR